jgi:hypothetical protein
MFSSPYSSWIDICRDSDEYQFGGVVKPGTTNPPESRTGLLLHLTLFFLESDGSIVTVDRNNRDSPVYWCISQHINDKGDRVADRWDIRQFGGGSFADDGSPDLGNCTSVYLECEVHRLLSFQEAENWNREHGNDP